jgi:exonuclease III
MSNTNNKNNEVKNIKNILLWNCNKIENKIDELFYTLDKENIDIICLNETKLEKDFEAAILNHPNYNYVVKSRNKFGGGVSIIIKKHIKYEEIEEINKFEVELICIKIKINKKEVFVITYYNPPNKKDIDRRVFEYIEENYKNYILCGDFNAKHIEFGCKINNKNGIIVNDFINSSNAVMLNKKDEFTYFREKNNYKEILDIFICSSNLYSNIRECVVDYDSELQSDHIPVRLLLNENNNIENEDKCNEKHLNYSKANWQLFKEQLELIDTSAILKSQNANEINEFLVASMKQAAGKAIPVKSNNLKTSTRLPKYIMDLINTRRKMKRKLLKNDYKNKEMLSDFYLINKTIREEIKAVKNKNWSSFIEKTGKNPLSSKAIWRRIQIIKNNGNKKGEKYPTLIHENVQYETDEKKADLFAELLSETFKDKEKEKYDDKFKSETNKIVDDFIINNECHEEVECINMANLNKILKNLKSKLSCGEDKITNIMLKKINEKFKIVLLHLCKTTVKTKNIPDLWKKVIVKMIPKNNDGKKDPKNYRPISITSCIARLCERFILHEISDHLKKNNIIIRQQSGFRSFRQTKDNIFAICQRSLEAFNTKKKKLCNFY